MSTEHELFRAAQFAELAALRARADEARARAAMLRAESYSHSEWSRYYEAKRDSKSLAPSRRLASDYAELATGEDEIIASYDAMARDLAFKIEDFQSDPGQQSIAPALRVIDGGLGVDGAGPSGGAAAPNQAAPSSSSSKLEQESQGESDRQSRGSDVAGVDGADPSGGGTAPNLVSLVCELCKQPLSSDERTESNRCFACGFDALMNRSGLR